MRTRLCVIVMLAQLFGISSEPLYAMQVGGNMWFHNDWSIQTAFADLVRNSRGFGWVQFDDPGCDFNPYPWGSIDVPEDLNPPLDEYGYPLEVPYTHTNGQQYRPVTIYLCEQRLDKFPYGTFTFMCKGTGEIHLSWIHKDTIIAAGGGVTRHEFTISGPGDIQMTRTPNTAAGLTLTIVRSDRNDHLRDMHLMLPGYADAWEQTTFTTEFLNTLKPFNPIRMMDWCGANHGYQSRWDQRVLPEAFCQGTSEGVAYEHQIDLCNALDRDLWICCPTHADDDYFLQLAALIKARLKPSLKCYIEWGNETWWQPAAAHYFGTVGKNWCYHGVRAAHLFKAFDDVFGAEKDRRLYKVLSGQSAGSGVASCILGSFAETAGSLGGVTANALAISCYFSGSDGEWSYFGAHQDLANQYGLDFITYEGGMGTGISPALYDRYKEVLGQIEGDLKLYMQYTICSPWSSSGNWGAMEYVGQPIDQAYKYKALLEYVTGTGQYDPNDIVGTEPGAGFPGFNTAITPLPSRGIQVVEDRGSLRVSSNIVSPLFHVLIIDSRGRLIDRTKGRGYVRCTIDTRAYAPGTHAVVVDGGSFRETHLVQVR